MHADPSSDRPVPADGTVVLAPGRASALSWPWRWLVFWCWYAWALVTSSKAVLKDLVTPGDQARSGIARIRSNCRTDTEVTLLSALITLTPGTLTLGQLGGGTGFREILVHSMYHEDDESALADLHDMDQRMTRSITIGGRS